ncbi:methyltransferase [Sphingomonas bacterium]|uniref:class I SAM-dependent methyltransferase n=1 Tax=Sphingomonas bacterium TaxID=1895847 RepID=UPI002615D845|nr:methyltransferase [Sphingomonas bacterium]MDB5678273.1 methyltransferase [Sphingomonas bacterium]
MRGLTMVLAAAALAVPVAVVAKAAISPAITKALADPARADQAGDDTRRHAAEVLSFAGVKPGQTVVDYLPGKGYWSRIFTNVVGPSGHVYSLWPHVAVKSYQSDIDALTARKFANVTADGQATNLPTVAKPVDLFWTVQNYHDLNNFGGEAGYVAFNQAVFAALKPGGIYLIVDHVAPAGRGLADTKTLHRIDPAIVKKQVLAAGFQWIGESIVLANPKDDHTLKVFDPAIRGVTDQFVYKFRKPLK